MPHCIIVMRNTGYTIIGPFASEAASRAWSGKHWKLDMDPRWQAIELDDPKALPIVLPPDSAAAVAAIQEEDLAL